MGGAWEGQDLRWERGGRVEPGDRRDGALGAVGRGTCRSQRVAWTLRDRVPAGVAPRWFSTR